MAMVTIYYDPNAHLTFAPKGRHPPMPVSRLDVANWLSSSDGWPFSRQKKTTTCASVAARYGIAPICTRQAKAS